MNAYLKQTIWPTADQLLNYTRDDLREIARGMDISIKGTKQELATRVSDRLNRNRGVGFQLVATIHNFKK